MERVRTAATRLALFCVAVLAAEAQISLTKHEHTSAEVHAEELPLSRPWDLKFESKSNLSLDAFDEEICGEANFEPWQKKQSAFGCTEASNERPIDPPNSFPMIGEFPFYVRIKPKGRKNGVEDCSGVLVDKQFVITTAVDCLRPREGLDGDLDEVDLEIGLDRLNGPGNAHRKGRNWCTSPRGIYSEDLAVIELDKPVDYVPGKIGPACLRWANDVKTRPCEHDQSSKESTCSLGTRYSHFVFKPFIHSMPIRATACEKGDPEFPHVSCFGRTTGFLGSFTSQPGSPLVCYDKCSSKNPDRVQAYVVGVVSNYGRLPSKRKNETTSVVDLKKARKRIVELVRALKSHDGESLSDSVRCKLQ